MKQSSLYYTFFLIIFLCICSPRSTFCTFQSPDLFVYNFYKWYFEFERTEVQPLQNDDIYKFACNKLVNIIREEKDIYYFTQGITGFGQWKDIKVFVHKHIVLDDSFIVVPVSLKSLDTRDIIVFLKRDGDSFKITKVSDLYPYS